MTRLVLRSRKPVSRRCAEARDRLEAKVRATRPRAVLAATELLALCATMGEEIVARQAEVGWGGPGSGSCAAACCTIAWPGATPRWALLSSGADSHTSGEGAMGLTDEQRLDLVVVTLATYNFRLEKAWTLREALQAEGLADPARVVGRSEQEVGNALKAAGYDRGGITYIIAPRLVTLMQATASGALDPLADALANGDQAAFTACLASVKGFGPKAAATAWALMAAGDGGRGRSA